MAEVVTVTSKGQVTLPSKLRRQLNIAEGQKLLVTCEDDVIRLTPAPRLSKLVGVDREVFSGRKPSREVEAMRREWSEEFEESAGKA